MDVGFCHPSAVYRDNPIAVLCCSGELHCLNFECKPTSDSWAKPHWVTEYYFFKFIVGFNLTRLKNFLSVFMKDVIFFLL